MVDMDHGGSVSDEPVFTYIAVGEKDGVVFPKILPGLSEGKDGGGIGKKKDGHRSLSRILKAVLFETSLAKKIKRRKLQRKLYQSNSNLLARAENFSKPIIENSIQNQELSKDSSQGIGSNSSSPFFNSSAITSSSVRSSSSSLSSNSRFLTDKNKSSWSNSIETKQRQSNLQEHGKGSYNSNIGLCLLLISFLVLVFWGKICAILCTSTWLFFVPRLCNDNNSSQNGVELLDSDEYKKRIIMEGLLQRNHARGPQPL